MGPLLLSFKCGHDVHMHGWLVGSKSVPSVCVTEVTDQGGSRLPASGASSVKDRPDTLKGAEQVSKG